VPDLTNRRHFLALAAAFEGSLAVIAWALGWFFELNPLARLTLEVRGLIWGVAGTIPMILLFALANRYPVGPLRKIKQFLHETLGPSLVACRWYDLLLVAAIAGISEELLFRGALQPLCGLFWSNVLFGFAHCITPTYVVFAGAVGGYLGGLMEGANNLLAPIVAHALYDFLAFLVVVRECRAGQATP
jgi:membrane protease YdiL (CAAX protease family)